MTSELDDTLPAVVCERLDVDPLPERAESLLLGACCGWRHPQAAIGERVWPESNAAWRVFRWTARGWFPRHPICQFAGGFRGLLLHPWVLVILEANPEGAERPAGRQFMTVPEAAGSSHDDRAVRAR